MTQYTFLAAGVLFYTRSVFPCVLFSSSPAGSGCRSARPSLTRSALISPQKLTMRYTSALLVLLCGVALAAAQTDLCSEEDTNFELVTGYVYSAPSDMLDSRAGTLMLAECIDMCRQNDSCQAFNYETGLCVLIDSNADARDDEPGEMADSEGLGWVA